jgi:AcrR family transcriptional regulator
MATTTRTRLTAEERRTQVLAAAMPEFARKGLAGTSTEDIARRAGISHPYLFRLFPTKKALFIAVVEACFQRVGDRFVEAAGDLRGQEALSAMGASYGELLADGDRLRMQMQAYTASDDPEVRDATRRGFGRLWEIAADKSGLSPDELRPFFAMGMLLNVSAALDLPSSHASWAKDCLPPGKLRQHGPWPPPHA